MDILSQFATGGLHIKLLLVFYVLAI